MFRFALLLTLSIALASCAVRDRIFRIVGGDLAKEGQFKYQAAVFVNGYLVCGGTILSSKVVLTAAHCIPPPTEKISIVAGTTKLYDNSGVTIPVEKVIVHERFTKAPRPMDNDLAILHLSSPLTFNDKIQPAELPSSLFDTYWSKTEVATVSGWGIEKEGGKPSDVLKFTQVTLVPRSQCRQRLYGALGWNVLCAAVPDGKKDACTGDSGGPLVIGNKLIGVVSYGFACGETTFPGVYADVSQLQEWIRKNGNL